MRQHELRQQIIDEMHLRRWPGLHVPLTVWQVVRTVADNERLAERKVLDAGIDAEAASSPAGARHIGGHLHSGVRFTWERHTEGSSLAVFVPLDTTGEAQASARAWIESFPGSVIRATQITVVATGKDADEVTREFGLRPADTVSGSIGNGIRFWSDFRLHESGYGRLVVAAEGADPVTLSRRVQQLQELGNYRNMALLGLPAVREQWPELDVIERKLRAFALSVSDPQSRDDMLLGDVSALSLDLATLNNAIGYRLDATKAYATLVAERLEDLKAEPVANFLSLNDFIRRRFLPAERTCRAHKERLDKLTGRAADLTALLRARIETRIENQNAQLLESMERRAEAQLRLQQLVEGLSIVAITYYGVGLFGYVVDALSEVMDLGHHDLIIGISVPVIMLLIWLFMRFAKRRVLGNLAR